MARRIGRAPQLGIVPALVQQRRRFAASLTSNWTPRACSRSLSEGRAAFAAPPPPRRRVREERNASTSSIRLYSSGASAAAWPRPQSASSYARVVALGPCTESRCVVREGRTRHVGLPDWNVITMTTLVKSTVRPSSPSVIRPFVEYLQERLEDVAVRLLDLVEQEHLIRALAHGLRSAAPPASWPT